MATTARNIVAGFFIILAIFGRIEGHPQASPIASNDDERSLRLASQTPQAAVSRVRQTLETEGKIIFPSDMPHNVHAATHTPVNLRAPAKCRNSTYCEHPTYYPDDFIKEALKTRQDLHYLATVDTDIGQRIDDSDGADESLCAYEETVIFPKTGQNKDKDWLYIVNGADFPQGVRIEACMTENTACNIIEGFAEGYKTTCKQKYVYRQLAAVTSNGTVGPELFSFPSSCCCHLKFAGNPLSRIGSGADRANKRNATLRTSRRDETRPSRTKK